MHVLDKRIILCTDATEFKDEETTQFVWTGTYLGSGVTQSTSGDPIVSGYLITSDAG